MKFLKSKEFWGGFVAGIIVLYVYQTHGRGLVKGKGGQ